MTGGVYEILNTVNGKRYIGSASVFARRRPLPTAARAKISAAQLGTKRGAPSLEHKTAVSVSLRAAWARRKGTYV